jgi:hypothetical protein
MDPGHAALYAVDSETHASQTWNARTIFATTAPKAVNENRLHVTNISPASATPMAVHPGRTNAYGPYSQIKIPRFPEEHLDHGAAQKGPPGYKAPGGNTEIDLQAGI